MSFFETTPPFIGRPLDRGRVFVIAERFDHASRFLELLNIPIGRWVYADSPGALKGYADGQTMLVCPSGHRNRNFTAVYQTAKERDFTVLFVDEDRTR